MHVQSTIARIQTNFVPNLLSFLLGPHSAGFPRSRYFKSFSSSTAFFKCQYGITGIRFFNTFSPSLSQTHSRVLHHLSELLLPSHLHDELAQRFRNEKYVLRMSKSGFSLLVGWLAEGMGGEASGSGEGFSGGKGKRGRAAIMRVVNNHLRFDGAYKMLSCRR